MLWSIMDNMLMQMDESELTTHLNLRCAQLNTKPANRRVTFTPYFPAPGLHFPHPAQELHGIALWPLQPQRLMLLAE